MIATFEQIKEMEENTEKVTMTSFTLDSETIKGIKQIYKGHKKSLVPALNSLLVEVVNQNVIKVTYQTFDITLEKMFLTTVNEINTKQFLIPIEVFKSLKYIKKNETFTFVEKNSETMQLIRNSVIQEIFIGDIQEFPNNNHKEQEYQVVETSSGYELFDNDDLQILVKATKTTSKSETRPVLQEVAIENKKVVSTDSHRLYQSHSVFNCKETILINPALINKANEIIAKNTFMKLSVSDNTVKITDDMTTTIYGRKCEGNYPDTSRIIPSEFLNEIKITKTKELHNFLKGLNKDNNVTMKVNKANSKIELETKLESGNSKLDLLVDIKDGGDFKVTFNGRYFQDAIEQLELEELSIKFISNNRPFILEKANSNKEFALVLPIRPL